MATKKAKKKPAKKKPTVKTAVKKKVVAKKKPAKKASPKKAKAKPVSKKAAPKKAKAKPVSKKAVPKKAKVKPVSKKAVPKKTTSKAKAAKKKTAPQKTATATSKPALMPAKALSTKKFISRQFLLDLAEAIKEAVAPVAREIRGREIVDTAPSGDATFEIDRIAEKVLLNFLTKSRAPIAYYSEDTGYSTFTNTQPQYLLVVDPIDGTRAAKNGFEGCVVSIAASRVIERPRLGDVDNACVMEILGDNAFYAERGKGAKIYTKGSAKKPKPSSNTDLEQMVWSMTVPGRPAELIFPTAARLIDLSSLKGGFFACNSTSFTLTRLLTGQQDAGIDVANRYLRDIPDAVEDYFINAGRGAMMGIAPYDIAASLLIAKEAGCVVTDAYGKSLEDVLMLDTSEVNMCSMIAAANPELHKKLISFFDARIRQYNVLLRRRHDAKQD